MKRLSWLFLCAVDLIRCQLLNIWNCWIDQWNARKSEMSPTLTDQSNNTRSHVEPVTHQAHDLSPTYLQFYKYFDNFLRIYFWKTKLMQQAHSEGSSNAGVLWYRDRKPWQKCIELGYNEHCYNEQILSVQWCLLKLS